MVDPKKTQLDDIAQELERRRAERLAGHIQIRRRRVILRRLLMFCAFVLAMLAGIFIFNFIRLNSNVIEGHVKQGLMELARGKTPFTVRKISGDLISGIEIQDLVVQNPHVKTGGLLLSIPRIALRYSLWDVFLGRIVLERLIVIDPSVVLARDSEGRANWNFSSPRRPEETTVGTTTTSTTTASSTEPVTEEDLTEQIADRYLQHIELKNVSLLIPKPRDLFPDQTLMKLLRIPPGNVQIAGLNLLLRKYPHPDFISHVLRLSTPDDPTWLTMQISRTRASGDVTASMDVLKQGVDLLIRNIGERGRFVSMFDRRKKERMNVRFIVSRTGDSILERMRDLSGVLDFGDLSPLQTLLPEGAKICGAVKMTASSTEGAQLVESRIEIGVASFDFLLPGIIPLERLNIGARLQNRQALITRCDGFIASLPTSHVGGIDFTVPGNAFASFSSDLGGERMTIEGRWKSESEMLTTIQAHVSRNAGHAGMRLDRLRERGMISYGTLRFDAGIREGGSLWDIVPIKLLPRAVVGKLSEYFSRVDLVGPLRIEAELPGPEGIGQGHALVDLGGAGLVSRQHSDARLRLGGLMRLSSGTIDLASVSATLGSLVTEASGRIAVQAGNKKIGSYTMAVVSRLDGGKPLVISGDRFWNSLGLNGTPRFDSLDVSGDRVLEARLTSATGSQNIAMHLNKLRLRRGKKSWWLDDVELELETDEPFDLSLGRPSRLAADATLKLFGFPGKARAVVNLADPTIDELAIEWKGDDFGPLLAALREHPGIDATVKKLGLDIGGAFTLNLKGYGRLNRPSLAGSISCPRLDVKAGGVSAAMPFDLSLNTGEEGEYRGDVSTKNAKISTGGVDFVLDGLHSRLTWGRPRGAKAQTLKMNGNTRVFDTILDLEAAIEPSARRIRHLRLKGQSRRLQTLMGEVARIGKFNLPFTVDGPAAVEFVASGTFEALTAKAAADVDGLDLRLPLQIGSGKTLPVDVSGISGHLELAQIAPGRFAGAITNGKARAAGGAVTLSGRARLEREGKRLAPMIDGLIASLAEVDAARLMDILNGGFLPAGVAGKLTNVTGKMGGKLNLSGGRNRYSGEGEVRIAGGGFRWTGIPEPISALDATILLARRQGRPESVVEWRNVKAAFGRSLVSIPNGQVIDPQKNAKLTMKGVVERAYPSDLLALLSGLKLPTVSFPKEGAFSGTVNLGGTLDAPRFDVDVKTEAVDIRYTSEGRSWTVPVGPGAVEMTYDLGTGNVVASTCDLGVMKGRVRLSSASGRLMPGKTSNFKLAGSIDGVDFGTLGGGITGGNGFGLKGILGGEFTAEQTLEGTRDAVFQLRLKNLVVEQMPLDPEMVSHIGLEFLEKPEFTESRLNLYVSSEGDVIERGRVRVADALFAGPEMRLEISDSAFDPYKLELAGKIVFNPQPLRHTKLGRKMGAMTRVLQDKSTGLPYLDLTVSGTWDRPELMAKALESKAKKRGKRNFIKSIFGGRRSHKASVQELMEWFPGWQPGK